MLFLLIVLQGQNYYSSISLKNLLFKLQKGIVTFGLPVTYSSIVEDDLSKKELIIGWRNKPESV